VGLFRRRHEPDRDPGEERLPAPEPAIADLLQELSVPYQRKGDAWFVEVGGAWATLAWIPRDGSVAGFLMYDGAPAPSADLVRANAEPGLAWHHTGSDGILTRVALPAADLGPAGLTLALGALRREAGGPAEPPLETQPRLDEALAELGGAPDEVTVTQRGDVVDLRIELEPQHGSPDEALASWMLEMSALRGARLGIDGAGALCAIAAVPARPVSAGGLAWGLEEVLALARIYRAA
jgi:hypothetical protein